MRDIDTLVAFATAHLAPIADKSGRILYSGSHTLRVGSIYLLGLNPGGDPTTHDDTVGSSLAELSSRKNNAYLDESWEYRGKPYPIGQSPLQIRVCWLLERLGTAPRDVCASNIIFTRSKGSSGSGYPETAELCWPVHEQIIRIVRPKVIVAFGNSGVSPYRFLRKQLHGTNETSIESGHGCWACSTFVGLSGIRVVGLPHLSRYAVINNPRVADWVKDIAL